MYKTVLNHLIHPKKIVIKLQRLNKKRKGSQISFLDLARYVKNNGIRTFFSKTIDIMRNSNNYMYKTPEYTQQVKNNIFSFQQKPMISIIMPVYNVDPKWLDLAIKSVENQWYPHWELCITDDCSTNPKTVKYLSDIENKKIKITRLKKNCHISRASNEAIKLSTGSYYAFMDNDDELTVNALYEIVKKINETDGNVEFLYSDEDKIDPDGTFSDPHFKTDYSPDMLMTHNYITHLSVIKWDLLKKIGGFTPGLEGSQDYDLILRATEHTNKIQHIPKILYHWRKIPGSVAMKSDSKNYAYPAAKKALENALKRRGLKGTVSYTKHLGFYKVKYDIKKNPLISIIISFKDQSELLKTCITSIISKSSYQNYEIIGIRNNSTRSKTHHEIEKLSKVDSRIRFFEYNGPYNFSQINNFTINKLVNGEQIILLNNNIEIITNDWMESMLEYSQRNDVGAVGTILIYPDGKIQHAGIILKMETNAFISFNGLHESEIGYFNRPHIVQNLSAVTGACLMVKKSLYQQIGGLNETKLKSSYQDVDFCLRLMEEGYLNVYTPYAKAIYHESLSRKYPTADQKNREKKFETNHKKSSHKRKLKKIKPFESEQSYIKKRHFKILQNGDPYFNPNLTMDTPDYRMKE